MSELRFCTVYSRLFLFSENRLLQGTQSRKQMGAGWIILKKKKKNMFFKLYVKFFIIILLTHYKNLNNEKLHINFHLFLIFYFFLVLT